MRRVKPTYWFEPHRFGLGSRPVKRQARVAIILLFTSISVARSVLPEAAFLVVGGLSVGTYFAVVAAKTRGGWGWRWNEVEQAERPLSTSFRHGGLRPQTDHQTNNSIDRNLPFVQPDLALPEQQAAYADGIRTGPILWSPGSDMGSIECAVVTS